MHDLDGWEMKATNTLVLCIICIYIHININTIYYQYLKIFNTRTVANLPVPGQAKDLPPPPPHVFTPVPRMAMYMAL